MPSSLAGSSTEEFKTYCSAIRIGEEPHLFSFQGHPFELAQPGLDGYPGVDRLHPLHVHLLAEAFRSR